MGFIARERGIVGCGEVERQCPVGMPEVLPFVQNAFRGVEPFPFRA